MTAPAVDSKALIVGRNIVIARKLRGMSQEHLAQLVGVTRPHLAQWETGRHEPRSANFGKLCEALDFPLHWFYKDHADDGRGEPVQ